MGKTARSLDAGDILTMDEPANRSNSQWKSRQLGWTFRSTLHIHAVDGQGQVAGR
jgi:hypothetical protein